jgi:F-type H+-transporting ATPase subunit gamma
MAGQLKEVRNRIKSVISTQQITKAMKMVSAAKLRRAQDRITQMRPYSQKLSEMLSNIVSASDGDVSIDLAVEREVKNALVIVMTADRGLCGAFNTNVNKAALQLIRTKYAALGEMYCVSEKRVHSFLRNIHTTLLPLMSNCWLRSISIRWRHWLNN